MMKRRRTNSKKPFAKRRRVTAKAGRYARIARPIRQQQLTFKRKFYVENWQPNTVTTAGFWRLFNVAPTLLPEWSSFASLFDLYKITGVLIEFQPRFSEFAGNDFTSSTTTRSGTRIHVINDPYSTLGPTGLYNSANLNSMLEQGNCRTYSGNRPVKIFSRPTIMFDVGSGSMIRRAPYLRTDSSATGHKCCHVFMQDQNFVAQFSQSFDIFYTYYIKFKNMR